MERNTGYIISSPLVLSVPADLRRKVTKLIAAKCALSARIDASQTSPSGKNKTCALYHCILMCIL